MLEKLLRPIYRKLVSLGLINIFVNKITKRISLTTAYYFYKAGLIPFNPTEQKTIYRTKFKTKKIVLKPDILSPEDPNKLIPSGSILSNDNAQLLPIVLFDATGLKDIANYVDKVAQLQLVTFGFKPMFITDQTDFSMFRKYGYYFEYIPDINSWKLTSSSRSYEDFVRIRKNKIVTTHRPINSLKLSDVDRYIKDFTNPIV